MSYRQKVMALARDLGAKVESGKPGSNFEVTADAPDGFHWKGDGLHQLVSSGWTPDEKAETMWRDAYERMIIGLEPCDYTQIDCADVAGKPHPDLAEVQRICRLAMM